MHSDEVMRAIRPVHGRSLLVDIWVRHRRLEKGVMNTLLLTRSVVKLKGVIVDEA